MFKIFNRHTALEQKNKDLETEIEKLIEENRTLSAFKREWEDVRANIKFVLDDTIPSGQSERKTYMSDVAAFYNIAFKDKVKYLIGLQYQALAYLGKTDREYDQYRMNINCFFLIDEWFVECTNEHLGNLEEMRAKVGSEEEFISNMKKEYNA